MNRPTDTQNKLKVELENTKRTLARVILERDEARETIRYLRELVRHVLSDEGTVQKRTRLSDVEEGHRIGYGVRI